MLHNYYFCGAPKSFCPIATMKMIPAVRFDSANSMKRLGVLFINTTWKVVPHENILYVPVYGTPTSWFPLSLVRKENRR